AANGERADQGDLSVGRKSRKVGSKPLGCPSPGSGATDLFEPDAAQLVVLFPQQADDQLDDIISGILGPKSTSYGHQQCQADQPAAPIASHLQNASLRLRI